MSDYTVLWTSKDGLRRTVYDTVCGLYVQVTAQTYDLEDKQWCDDWDPLELDHLTAKLLGDKLTEFIANRPHQVHNGIEWHVRDGVVLLNGVETYALPTSGVDMRVAGELVSKLLTTARSLNLFIGIPELSDVEAELWIAARINDIAEACEF